MKSFKQHYNQTEINETLISEYGKDINWVSNISDNGKWISSIKSHGEYYTKNGEILIRVWEGSVSITDIYNAFKTGKKADHFSFDGDFSDFVDLIPKDAKYNNMMTLLFIMTENGVDIKSSQKRSIDLYNPLALKHLKKVVKIPSRLNRMHLIKVIANQQYTILRSDYNYTDDYAFDSDRNFNKNSNLNPVATIRKIMSMNNVLFTNVNKDGFVQIHFGAHSNDGNTCVTTIKG